MVLWLRIWYWRTSLIETLAMAWLTFFLALLPLPRFWKCPLRRACREYTFRAKSYGNMVDFYLYKYRTAYPL